MSEEIWQGTGRKIQEKHAYESLEKISRAIPDISRAHMTTILYLLSVAVRYLRLLKEVK